MCNVCLTPITLWKTKTSGRNLVSYLASVNSFKDKSFVDEKACKTGSNMHMR